MTEKIHRSEIQKSIYDDLGITDNMVIKTYRDSIDKSFTIDEVKGMDEDEFNYYFDMGHNVDRSVKESFIEMSKKVDSYEGLMDIVKPKSSFKAFNKKVSNLVDKHLDESSLSRLWKHNELHDCGAITAFRKYHNCGYDVNGDPCDDTPVELSTKEKTKRNLALASDIKKMGYNTTKIVGKYPEGGSSIKEVSYFVVDVNDTGNLEKDIKTLGEKYNQDSVLFIQKGAIQNTAKAWLIGTNRCCNNWLGFGQMEVFNKGKVGYDSPVYTTYVNGRPFVFEDIKLSDEIFGSRTNAIMAGIYSEQIGNQ